MLQAREAVRGASGKPMPDEAWDGLEYTNIHASILFADLEHSVLLSSTENPRDYQRLINAAQSVMLSLVERLRCQGMPLGEFYVAGDQLAVFFYDEDEVRRNWLLDGPDAVQGEARAELIRECRKANEALAFNPLSAAIQLKTLWLCQDFNLQRVREHRTPLSLGMGMHFGRVFLCTRPDGRRRVEGYSVNLAKRIETYSRNGQYSRIMLSQEAHNIIRGSIRKHTMLRQRIFFAEHQVGLELLKGVTRSQPVYELKFYSRIGLNLTPEAAGQYEVIFGIDPTAIWAYYQLFEHYAYSVQDWEKALDLAKRAHLVHPNDEKVLLDLSRCYYNLGNRDQAMRFAQQALAVNPQFDLVYEHLAVLAEEAGDAQALLDYLSRALSLTPGSPVNHLNLGSAQCERGLSREGTYNLRQAFEGYPQFLLEANVQAELHQYLAEGRIDAEFAASYLRADPSARDDSAGVGAEV